MVATSAACGSRTTVLYVKAVYLSYRISPHKAAINSLSIRELLASVTNNFLPPKEMTLYSPCTCYASNTDIWVSSASTCNLNSTLGSGKAIFNLFQVCLASKLRATVCS